MPATTSLPSTLDLRARLHGQAGFCVVRRAVDTATREAALRRVNLEIPRTGLSPDDVWRGIRGTFFPHVRWEQEILDLQRCVEQIIGCDDGEQWADPQLLLRFPDEVDSHPPLPHVDEVPPWAPGRRYVAIAGVALTRSWRIDGCLHVRAGSHRGGEGALHAVELDPGDVVVMHPSLAHCSGLNRGGAVRYAVYLRLLAAPTAAPAPSASPIGLASLAGSTS